MDRNEVFFYFRLDWKLSGVIFSNSKCIPVIMRKGVPSTLSIVTIYVLNSLVVSSPTTNDTWKAIAIYLSLENPELWMQSRNGMSLKVQIKTLK